MNLLSLLSHSGNKAELLQHSHHIVVDVYTDDLPIPDLHGIAEPQFGWSSCRWDISSRQMQGTCVGTPTNKLNGGLIFCSEYVGYFYTAARKAICEKEKQLLVAIWTTRGPSRRNINDLAILRERCKSFVKPGRVRLVGIVQF